MQKQALPKYLVASPFKLKVKAATSHLCRLYIKAFEGIRRPCGKNTVVRSQIADESKLKGQKQPKVLPSKSVAQTPTSSVVNTAKKSNTVDDDERCFVFYGSGPILRYKNKICRLIVRATDMDTKNADCEWLDAPPLAGKHFDSMNMACEAMRECINGRAPSGKRWTVNAWTNLTITPGGTTLKVYKTNGSFHDLLGPVPSQGIKARKVDV